MNRRKFLAASLAATTGGILVAADVLSTKTFFLPPAGGWARNSKTIHPDLWRVPEGVTVCIRTGALGPSIYVGDFVGVDGAIHRITSIESGWGNTTRLDLAPA